MQNINQEEFISLSKETDHIILDVRRPDECATGIVADAIIINFMDNEKFIETIKELDKSKKYLIYCRSGNRSGKACLIMDQMDFDHTYNLIGGMMNWTGQKVTPV